MEAVETLVTQVQDQTWTISWAPVTLTVSITAPRPAPVVLISQLRPGTRRDATATTALGLLRSARERFGTAALAPPLP